MVANRCYRRESGWKLKGAMCCLFYLRSYQRDPVIQCDDLDAVMELDGDDGNENGHHVRIVFETV